jgi:hypothetical protein
VVAENLKETKERLQAKHGKGNVFDLNNEETAARTRQKAASLPRLPGSIIAIAATPSSPKVTISRNNNLYLTDLPSPANPSTFPPFASRRK